MTTMVNPTIVQQVFQGFGDGTQTGSTQKANANTNFSQALGEIFHMRFRIAQTAAANQDLAHAYKLRYQKNGTGGFIDVGAQGSGEAVRYMDSASITDNENIATANFRLGAGTGTAIQGECDENGATDSITFTSGSASYTELLFVIELNLTGNVDDDTFEFHVYETDNTALNTYTVTPTVTAIGPVDTPQVITANVDAAVTFGAKSITKTILAGADAVVAFVKSGTTTISAAVDASVNLTALRVFFQTITANVDAAVTFGAMSVGKVITVGVDVAVTFTKAITTTLTAAAIAVSSTLVGAANHLQSITVNVSAAMSFGVFSVGKIITSLVDASVTFTKSVPYTISAGVDVAATILNNTGKIISAGITTAAEAFDTVFSAAAAFLAGVYGSIMGASIGSTSIMGSQQFAAGATEFLQTITAMVDAGATFTKNVGKAILTGVDVAATFIKNVGKIITANVDALAQVWKGLLEEITTSVVVGATVLKDVGKIITANVVILAVTFARSVGKIITPLVNITVTFSKALFYTITANVVVAATINTVRVLVRRIMNVFYY